VQSRHGEAFRGNCGAQQITIVEQKSAVTLSIDRLPVVDADKGGFGTQPLRDLPGKGGAALRVGTLNTDQYEAGTPTNRR
jgi:hypothetical protein